MATKKKAAAKKPAARKSAADKTDGKNLPVKFESGGAVTPSSLMEDVGMGNEGVSQQDLSVPFLAIIQKGSPQVDPSEGVYDENAKPGMIFNTVTGELFPEGILVVPATYQRSNIEWVPRNKGGGFVKNHGTDDTELAKCERVDHLNVHPNGNQIVPTGAHFVILLKEDGSREFAVISMSSTQLKKSNRWNSIVTGLKVPRPDGKGTFNPPRFFRSYRLSTVPESNDKGSWFGWQVEPEQYTLNLEDGEAIYLEAREFCRMANAGNVEMNAGNLASDDGDAAAEDEDTPF